MLTQHQMMRLAPIGVFAAIVVSLGFALRNDAKQMPSQLIDKAVPNFALKGLTPNDPGLASTDLGAGDDIKLVNIFASWCAGCRVEHPTLMRIAAEKRAPLYAINWKDKPGDGLKWLKANQNPYGKIGEDANGRVGIDLGVTGVPETFVIDKSGRVRYRHAGPVTDDVWAANFAPLIAELRKERP
jgi:cytochrome c biogenesis protein CcmG, thiol:disulfide interchange protein DsbE